MEPGGQPGGSAELFFACPPPPRAPRQAESNRAGIRPLGGWSPSRFGVSYAIISTAIINAVVIGMDARKDFVFRLL